MTADILPFKPKAIADDHPSHHLPKTRELILRETTALLNLPRNLFPTEEARGRLIADITKALDADGWGIG